MSYSLSGHELFVSPTGATSTAAGIGTAAAPWALQTAFSGAGGKIKPGDVVWIKSGTYAPGAAFDVAAYSTALQPIVFRAVPGERVTLDGRALKDSLQYLNGSHFWLWGLEITDSNPATPTFAISYGTYGISSGSVTSVGAKLINIVSHDNYNGGIGLYSTMSDVEIYGALSFCNGRADNPNHGYGVYSQNQFGHKTYEDFVVFNNFGNYPAHFYSVAQAVARPPGFSPWVHTKKEFNVFIVERVGSTSLAPGPNPPTNLRQR